MTAIFVSLDIQSECQVEKDVFKREMNKIYSLLDRGISDEQEREEVDERGRDEEMVKDEGSHKDKDEITYEEETGVEAGNKKAHR